MKPSRLLGGSAALALAFTAFAPGSKAATDVGDQPIDSSLTQINLINTNDFHGHFTKEFACTVTTAQDEDGAVFLSAGDNVGGTPFASASQNDNPSIDYLNALNLRASAVGNHEFDKGFDDLRDRVQPRANFKYLGANVYQAGTSTPALPEYEILEINGVRVAVVGAVTKDVPSLVGASGISGLSFGDPVAAVNRVADKLTDGDTANGEADVIVAEYHEGAPVDESSTIDQATASSTVFKSIVEDTSSKVSAIFTGHTHKLYQWNGATSDGTRPVIQSDFYASHLGMLKLGYNPETKKVEQYAVENRPVVESTEGQACEGLPAYQAAARIVDDANARADVIGAQKIGELTGDITTALKADGSRDDRLRESTLSNMIAQSYVDSINAEGRPGGADIGIMNPGGVRADLTYGEDGTITYADAAAIMPFANTIVLKDYTGAQFLKVLEEQWQPEDSSRAFLKLGLSENVTYTYDPTKPKGERITSVTIDGQPLDPNKTYTVASNSFLLDGGDNFTTLGEGTNKRDTGLIDQSLFVDWIKDNSPLSPNFAKNGVAVENQPTTIKACEKTSFTVSGLDMTSAGSPTTTSVDVFVGETKVATVPVTKVLTEAPPYPTRNQSAAVSFELPESVPAGTTAITVKSEQTGTVVTIPVTVESCDDEGGPTDPGDDPSKPGDDPSKPGDDPTGPPIVTDGEQPVAGAGSNAGVVAGGAFVLVALAGGGYALRRRLN